MYINIYIYTYEYTYVHSKLSTSIHTIRMYVYKYQCICIRGHDSSLRDLSASCASSHAHDANPRQHSSAFLHAEYVTMHFMLCCAYFPASSVAYS